MSFVLNTYIYTRYQKGFRHPVNLARSIAGTKIKQLQKVIGPTVTLQQQGIRVNG